MIKHKRRMMIGLGIFITGTFVVLIFILSSMAGDRSDLLSRSLTTMIYRLIYDDNIEPYLLTELNTVIRKLAHFILYSVFATLIFSLVYRWKKKLWLAAVLTLLCCWGVAIIDEINQLSTLGRSGSKIDIVIDSLGVSIAVINLIVFIMITDFFLKSKSRNGD